MPRNNSHVRKEERRKSAERRRRENHSTLTGAERLLAAIYGKTPEEAMQEGMFDE